MVVMVMAIVIGSSDDGHKDVEGVSHYLMMVME